MQRETLYDAVFDAQAHYRLLLDCMARPGKINHLPPLSLAPPPGLSRAAALTGFALLDANASFYVADEAAACYLMVNTSARLQGIASADFVFTGGSGSHGLVAAMKKGTLTYPDEGATLVVDVETLSAESGRLALTLSGPGVPGERTFHVNGLDAALIDALRECNAEFPLGIDLVVADAAGAIACIPRSTKIKSVLWDM